MPSLPSRERGLKFPEGSQRHHGLGVAPLAGAWIEICKGRSMCAGSPSSLPSRERGLKLTNDEWAALAHQSLPSRERGLK